MLNEVLAALPLILVVLMLLTTTTAVVLRSYRGSPQIANEYTAIDGLLDCLREDTRATETARWTAAQGASSGLILPSLLGVPAWTTIGSSARDVIFHTASGDIRYRFEPDRVYRKVFTTGGDGGELRCWNLDHWSITATDGHESAGLDAEDDDRAGRAISLLTVRICWRGRSKHSVDPVRHFEAGFYVGRGYQR